MILKLFRNWLKDQYGLNSNLNITIMKKLLLCTSMVLASLVINAQQLATATSKAAFGWEEAQTYDFGKITKDEPATHIFKFTNTGEEPLIISNAKASCGCTVAGYTKEPIPPGQSGEIVATYNAKKPGPFQKGITVTSNASESVITLYLKGEVIE